MNKRYFKVFPLSYCMKKYLIAIHYINNKESLNDFKIGLNDFKSMIEIFKKKDPDFVIGLRLSVESNISGDIKNQIKGLIKELPDTLFFYDPNPLGGGTSQAQVLFNPAFDKGIAISASFDQYIIGSEIAVCKIIDLINKVEKENSIYATGSRENKVILANISRNSDIRIIHELYHSLTIGIDKLQILEKPKNVTPAYSYIGENSSGFDIINHNHAGYLNLAKDLEKSRKIANLNGFANNYYVALKSKFFGNISKGYVLAKENPINSGDEIEEKELKSIKKMIFNQTKELGKTDVRKYLIKALKNKNNELLLSKFYPMEDIFLVKNLMLDALN